MYVRDNVEIGMLVRCCKSYEEIHVGDIGKVIKIDREGLHDLNLQVILLVGQFFDCLIFGLGELATQS